MKNFLDLRVQVDLYHDPVNHSPLPWAGISYTLSMSAFDTLRAMLRRNWLAQVETATLAAVVTYYRRGVTKPTTVRLALPREGKVEILGIASHGPRTPSLWRRVRRLTPSGKRNDIFSKRPRNPAKDLESSSNRVQKNKSPSCVSLRH